MKHLLLTTIAAVVLVGCGVSKETTIWKATEEGDASTVELVISLGQDVNAKDDDGRTPLHHAITKEIAELLITNGADVNAKMFDGKTPLDFAEYKPELADLLRKHGGKTKKELEAEGK